MTKIVLWLLSVLTCLAVQIIKQMPSLKLSQQQLPITPINVANSKKFLFEFDKIPLEISAKMMIASQSAINDQNVFKETTYKEATNCEYHRSDFEMTQIDSQMSSFYADYYLVEPKQQKIYYGSTIGKLIVFDYNKQHILPGKEIKLNDLILNTTQSYKLFNVNGQVYLTDSFSVVWLSTIYGETPKVIHTFKQPEIINIYSIADNSNKFWVLRSDSITIYTINANIITQQKKYTFGRSNQYLDGIYDEQLKQFYLLGQNTITIYIDETHKYDFKLQGNCYKIKKHHSTLHLVCYIQRKNYIGEYLLVNTPNSPQLILNRYYNDMDNVQSVFYLEDGIQMMMGEDETIIMSQAVHRQSLLQLTKKQVSVSFTSNPAYEIVPLPHVGHQYPLIVIEIDRVVMVNVKRITPYAFCTFDRSIHGAQVYLATIFNTSYCSQEGKSQYSTILGICKKWQIYRVTITQTQYDHKSALVITSLIIVVSLIVCFLCVGCGLKRIQDIKGSISKAAKKLKAYKDKKLAPKPI